MFRQLCTDKAFFIYTSLGCALDLKRLENETIQNGLSKNEFVAVASAIDFLIINEEDKYDYIIIMLS